MPERTPEELAAVAAKYLDALMVEEVDIASETRDVTQPGDQWKRYEPTGRITVTVVGMKKDATDA